MEVLHRKQYFVVIFSMFAVLTTIYVINVTTATFFGEHITNIVTGVILAMCFLWGLFTSLLSGSILSSSMQPILEWFGNQSRGQYVDEVNAAHKSVADAEKKMGVKIHKTLISDDNSINAFMAGIREKVVVFYKGLLDNLSPSAIRGVAYHEVAHAKNNDIWLTLFCLGFISAYTFIAQVLWWITKQFARFWWLVISDEDKENGGRKLNLSKAGGLGAAGVASGSAAADLLVKIASNDMFIFGFLAIIYFIGAQIIGQMVSSLISQNRELLADATAVKYGAGEDMLAALEELKAVSMKSAKPTNNSSLVASIGIVPSISFLTPTHPPMDVRARNVKRLMTNKLPTMAGSFIFLFLTVILAYGLGWTMRFNPEAVFPTVLGVPTAFIAIISTSLINLSSMIGRTGTSLPDKDETATLSKDKQGSYALKGLGYLSALFIWWAFCQLAIYHTFGMVWFLSLFGASLLSGTLSHYGEKNAFYDALHKFTTGTITVVMLWLLIVLF